MKNLKIFPQTRYVFGKIFLNKKVLLRERKRHTTRSASLSSNGEISPSIPDRGIPPSSPDGEVPLSSPDGGGVPRPVLMGGYHIWSQSVGPAGSPPPVRKKDGYLHQVGWWYLNQGGWGTPPIRKDGVPPFRKIGVHHALVSWMGVTPTPPGVNRLKIAMARSKEENGFGHITS